MPNGSRALTIPRRARHEFQTHKEKILILAWSGIRTHIIRLVIDTMVLGLSRSGLGLHHVFVLFHI